MSAPAKRLHIERLELDLRGIDARAAESLARAIGPALARALAHLDLRIEPGARVDAGRIDIAAVDAKQAAQRIAQRIARHLSAKDS